MNGRLVRVYEADMLRGVTVISLLEGRTVTLEKGQRVTVREDHYGNTYIDGVHVLRTKFAEVES